MGTGIARLACWRVGGLLGLLVLMGCPAAPSPVQPPSPAPSASPSSIPAPSPSPVPPPPAHESNVFLQLTPYRAQFEQAFATLLGDEAKVWVDGSGADTIAHQVVSYAHPRGVLTVTIGFARRAQPFARGETPAHVELIARSPRASKQVAQTLAALGSWMHAPDRALDVRFKAYEPLRLPIPLFGREHFLLMPASESTLQGGERIAVLRVIPADEQEYARIKMRGDGAARAWWHEHRSDALLERWAPMAAGDR